jgi:Cd2+/Zn2+-exporting ATPase
MNNLNRSSREDNPLAAICSCCHEELSFDRNAAADSPDDIPLPKDIKITRLLIRNMDCPTEEGIIRNALGNVNGITKLDFNLLEREMTVYHNMVNTAEIVSLLNAIDMPPLELSKSCSQKSEKAVPYFSAAHGGC